MVAPQRPPYDKVFVRGLSWEHHDQKTDQGPVRDASQEMNMVMRAFDEYGYEPKTSLIPTDDKKRAGFVGHLQDKFDEWSRASRRTLVILYYQGHGHLDHNGHLVFTNKSGKDSHRLNWSELANLIIAARVDVLALLNCHHAGAAAKACELGRPNYEHRTKQVMMAVPEGVGTAWGSASGFAACLEQALRDRRASWESDFEGIPRHWAKAINRTIASKPKGKTERPKDPVSVVHLVPRPDDRPSIVVAPLKK